MERLIKPRQSSPHIFESMKQRAQEAEECFSLTVQSAYDGLCDWDITTNGISFSPRWKELLGYEEFEISNQLDEWMNRVYPDDLERVQTALQQHFEGFTVQHPFEYCLQHKDGSYRWIYAHAIVLRNTLRNPYRLLIWHRDMTEHKQIEYMEKQCSTAEEALKRRTRELSLLLEILRTVQQIDEPEPLAATILETLKTIIHCTSATFFLREGPYLHILDYRGPLKLEDVRSLRFLPEQVFLYQELLRTGKACIIDDIQAIPPLSLVSPEPIHEQLQHLLGPGRSFLAVPLVIKERIMGSLLLTSCEPHFYTPLHAEIALALATQVAVTLQHARHLSQKQHGAILEERQRLAHELHDSLSQGLYGIGLGAHTVREELDNDPQQAIGPIEYVISLAEMSLAEMRALIFDLQPDSLQHEGLLATLNKHILMLRTHYKLTIHTQFDEEPDISLEAKQALFRITQEACFNTIKHAHASTITIRLNRESTRIILEVSDDGIGFDTWETFPGHLGCISMKKRAAQIGSTLSIESAANLGTHIKVSVPT